MSIPAIIQFIRDSKTNVTIRTQGYSPAWLPAEGADWSDERLATFLRGEILNLDSCRRLVDRGGIVSMFVMEAVNARVVHYHIAGPLNDLKFIPVL